MGDQVSNTQDCGGQLFTPSQMKASPHILFQQWSSYVLSNPAFSALLVHVKAKNRDQSDFIYLTDRSVYARSEFKDFFPLLMACIFSVDVCTVPVSERAYP